MELECQGNKIRENNSQKHTDEKLLLKVTAHINKAESQQTGET